MLHMSRVWSPAPDQAHTVSAEKTMYAFHTAALRVSCGKGGPEWPCAVPASLGKGVTGSLSPYKSEILMVKYMADPLGHPSELGSCYQ